MRNLFLKNLFLFFVIFLTFFAHADFQNDLPSNFPAPTQQNKIQESNLPLPTQSKTNLKKKSKAKTASTSETTSVSPNAFGQDIGNHDNNAPVFFSGNHADGSRTTGILNLVGNAIISQDDTTLKSNKAQIFSFPGTLPTPGMNRIQRALATGNVRIVKKATLSAPEIKASGDETEFFVQEKILILKGRAKVWKINEYLNGDIIKVNLNSGDIEVLHPEGTVDPKSANNSFSNGSK